MSERVIKDEDCLPRFMSEGDRIEGQRDVLKAVCAVCDAKIIHEICALVVKANRERIDAEFAAPRDAAQSRSEDGQNASMGASENLLAQE